MRTGHCLCEAVSFRVEGPLEDVLHCHCENCRRLTGNFIAACRAPWGSVTFESDRGLRWYELPYARYGFCGECGATLFFEPAENPERVSITAGSLDDVSGLALGAVWFAGDAQPHNALPQGVPHFDGNA